MAQQQIQKFNQQLINDGEVITIVDYVKKLNNKFFHIDLSFIEDFIELVGNDEFCIHHEMLQKYEVLKIKDTYDVKRVFEQYMLEEDEDYKINPRTNAGGLDYFMKPEIFKMILMRSRNTRKYTHYDLLLENV